MPVECVGSEFVALGELQVAPTESESAWKADLALRLEQLEHENIEFTKQHSMLLEQIQELRQERDWLAQPANDQPTSAAWSCVPCQYDHERGEFVIIRGREDHPFELRADFWTEARYTNFGANRDFWIDSTGTQFPINNFDSMEITRNFVRFSGFGMDPKLQYTVFIFSSTALNDTLYLGWINYRFSDALDVRVGTWQLPGTREWYQSHRYTMGTERLMATTFFRPNISPGIWAQGELFENVRYVAMFANSQNRFSQGVERIGSSRAFSGSMWWEPTGAFGPGPSDIENHNTPSLRLGFSMTFSEEANQGFGDPAVDNPEDTILRLSDGTPLFRPGALAPGVQLESTRYNLWAIDAAVKCRGLGLSFEYFFRLLNDFDARPTPLPFDSLFDHGGLLDCGYFVVPSKLEVFGRTSHVTGRFGTGSEYGGGINWYPKGTREWRFTAEVLEVSDSPAENLLTGYRAGESGTLFQLQWFVDF